MDNARAGLTRENSRFGVVHGNSRTALAHNVRAIATGALAAWYLSGYGRAQLRAAKDPSAGRIRAAVGAGILDLPQLQGALTAKAGSPAYGLGLALVAPLARRLARKVSPT